MANSQQEALISIFEDHQTDAVRYQQDGVVLKGNPHDDKRNYVGTLLLMEYRGGSTSPLLSASDSAASPAQTCQLIWLPYSYLFCLAPHLVSSAARRAIDTEAGELPLDLRDPNARMRVEWHFSVCLPLSRVLRLQRKSNLRGKKILTVTRLGNSAERPLIFQDGGIVKFFDEMKRYVDIRPAAGTPDEFEVEPRTDDVAIAAMAQRATASSGSPATPMSPPNTPAVGAGAQASGAPATPDKKADAGPQSPTQVSSSRSSVSGSTPQQHGDPNAQFKQNLYNAPASPGMMSQVMSFGASITQKGRSVAEAVLGPSASSTDLASNNRGDSEEWSVVDPMVPIEALKPKIVCPPSRKLGGPLTSMEWRECFDADGKLDPDMFRQARVKVFGGGCAPDVRAEVWSFLLGVYQPESTHHGRAQLKEDRRKDYENMRLQWQLVTPEQEKKFSKFREHKIAIEKDVLRTDRNHPAFRDEGGEKMKQLYNILMSYAMFNFDLGYCQGMSDMLSIILLIYDDEADAYVHFKFLMSEKCEGNFRNDVKASMTKQLDQVGELVRIFCPSLYNHLDRHCATNMTWIFRWLLVLFKREFDVHADVMLLWDVIFSAAFTPQYEVLLTAGLIRNVSNQIVDQALSYDELIKFANAMSGELKVNDFLLIGLEFYDVAASHMVRKSRLRAGENTFRPKLADILSAFENDSIGGRDTPPPR